MHLNVSDIISRLNLDSSYLSQGDREVRSPVNGDVISSFSLLDELSVKKILKRGQQSFLKWRETPAKQRCALMALFAGQLRQNEEDLARLIMAESGKLYADALSEVKKSIEICEYVSGLWQRISSLSVPVNDAMLGISEAHLPLGLVGVITGFNFPLRDFIVSAAPALACGNTIVWKPSRYATLTALAANTLIKRAIAQSPDVYSEFLCQNIVCSHEVVEFFARSDEVVLMCAVGSNAMARCVMSKVTERLGRSLLSSGGNNACIVSKAADLDSAALHLSAGTIFQAGQSYATIHRIFCHIDVYSKFVEMFKERFTTVSVDAPYESKSQMGPLISKQAYDRMMQTLDQSRQDGGKVTGGRRMMVGGWKNAYYVEPAVIELPTQTLCVQTPLQAPVAYVMPYIDIEDAIDACNGCPNTLITCMFSNDLKETGLFASPLGAKSRVSVINSGTLGIDFIGGDLTLYSEMWRPYTQTKTCLTNYNF